MYCLAQEICFHTMLEMMGMMAIMTMMAIIGYDMFLVWPLR